MTVNMQDQQLVIQYQNQKDNHAFSELYQRYYHKVFKYCFKIIGNREDALDVTADVFVKVAEKLDQLQHQITFQAWLFRIARNASLDVCKKRQQKRCISLTDDMEVVAEDFDLEGALERERKMEKMGRVLEIIPDEARELLLEKYYEKATLEQMWQRHHTSESAIKMRLLRARNKARKMYCRA